MTSLTVFRVNFKLGDRELDGYSAHEKDEKGFFVNYMSGRGLAESIGCHHDTVGFKRMAKELKSMLGEGFTVAEGRYKMASGGTTKVDLWSTQAAATYYGYHAKQGNKEAMQIVIALISTTLDRIIDDAFNREYEKGEAEAKAAWRLAGKLSRRAETDQIKVYLDTHDVSDSYRRYIYSNVTDLLYLAMFGMKAKQLREHLKVDPKQLLRDQFTRDQLEWINIYEKLSSQWMAKGMEPLEAMRHAITLMEPPKFAL